MRYFLNRHPWILIRVDLETEYRLLASAKIFLIDTFDDLDADFDIGTKPDGEVDESFESLCGGLELFVDLRVKWDGCINWYFPDGPPHTCGDGAPKAIGEALCQAHKMAIETLGPEWDGPPVKDIYGDSEILLE